MKTFIYFSQGEWRTFYAEELPVKPNPKDYLYPGPLVSDIRAYESEIAALKAKSLPVGNPKMFTNTQGYWLDVNVGNGKPKEDEIYRWPGTVEISPGGETIDLAILKLPA